MNIDKEDKFIGTLTVSDINQMDLFRIHMFDDAIKFDKKFALGLLKNGEVLSKVMRISDKWSTKQLDSSGVFIEFLSLLKKHEKDISDLFFQYSELDSTGRYVEPTVIDSSNFKSVFEKLQANKHFIYLKNSGNLNKIDERVFRTYLVNQDLINFYLDNFNDYLQYSYYSYFVEFQGDIKQCFVMAYNDEVVMGISVNI